MQPSVFKERSRLLTLELGISMIPVFGVMAYLIWQLTLPASLGSTLFSCVILILLLGVLCLIFFATLKVTIQPDKVSILFFPFVKRTIDVSHIKTMRIQKVNPIRDFGGWGIRKNKTLGKVYTTKGDQILFFELDNDERIGVSVFDLPALKTTLHQHFPSRYLSDMK